jgi:hypothetical protein
VRRIAVTGHRALTEPTILGVTMAIRGALRETGTAVWGLSCLAAGADQIFARAVLEAGGQLEVIIPAARYRDGMLPGERAGYDALLPRAAAVHRLEFADPTGHAHMAAGAFLIGRADELWAVWDGEPARGYGGTADVVACARDRGVPVRLIWPAGARRD